MPMLFGNSKANIALLCFSPVLCSVLLGCGNGLKTVQAAEDPQTLVEGMLQTQQDAWNKNDAIAYAAPFAENVDFINIRGQIFTGKTQVTQLHAKIFAGPFRGSNISIKVRNFQLLAPGVALVDTDQTVTGYAALPPGIVPTTTGTLSTHFKYVAQEAGDGTWAFTSGQNTSALPN